MLWLAGLHIVFLPINLLAMVIGSAIGLFIGSLPGLGPAFALTLFLPMTFALPSAMALIFLVSMYTAAVYGGAITAVLINVPGHPGNIATTFDGQPMAHQGRAGEAIAAIGVAGALAGMMAVVFVVFFSPLAIDFALRLTSADYFMLAIFGLSLVSSMAGRNVVQAMILAGIGFLSSTVGRDPINGIYRFTFGSTYLKSDGISFSVMVVGVFAIGSAFLMLEQRREKPRPTPIPVTRDFWIGVRSAFRHPFVLLRASVVGILMGVIPGLGIAISNIAAYVVESKLHPRQNWGKGNVAGVMAPEAADNATLIAELVPAFTLGIPGAATSALILDAVTVHGLQPGPMFFSGNPLTSALFIAMFLSQIVFAIWGILLARVLAHGARIPTAILGPVILVMGMVGAYAIHGSIGDIVVALVFGLVGYVIMKLRLPVAPLVLGSILGPLAENNYRQAVIIDAATRHSTFLEPFPLTLGLLSALVFITPLIGQVRALLVGHQPNLREKSASQIDNHG